MELSGVWQKLGVSEDTSVEVEGSDDPGKVLDTSIASDDFMWRMVESPYETGEEVYSVNEILVSRSPRNHARPTRPIGHDDWLEMEDDRVRPNNNSIEVEAYDDGTFVARKTYAPAQVTLEEGLGGKCEVEIRGELSDSYSTWVDALDDSLDVDYIENQLHYP